MSPASKATHSFHYNAHGHGLSGQFHRPFQEMIEVQAGMSLPLIGGHGHSRAENFKFKEIGRRHGGPHCRSHRHAS